VISDQREPRGVLRVPQRRIDLEHAGAAEPRAGSAQHLVDHPDLSMDAAGNLYVAWDSQAGGHNISWLSYSADQGSSSSRPLRVTPDTGAAPHIMAVAGGTAGTAYVGWLGGSGGYSMHLSVFSAGRLSPVKVSAGPGRGSVCPGDTVGISSLPGTPPRVAVSWGGAEGWDAFSQVRTAIITVSSRLPKAPKLA
jgi:hypothetical protein